jgi:hypothetical protein
MGLLEAPRRSVVAAAATLLRVLGPRRVAAPAASSPSGASAPVGGAATIDGASEPPNPLMQLTNADGARLRPPTALRWRAADHRFSQVVCN